MKKGLLVFFTLLTMHGFAQDVLMQNGSINVCSGTFYDSGGEFGNYSNNESLIFTICPETTGERVKLDFLEFSTQLNADLLTIYDGDSTSSSIINIFSGALSPGLIVASLNNPTGCLTIAFTSNNSGATYGWAAIVSCTTPCQDITAQLDSTVPLPNNEGIIEVCTEEPITLNGSGIFEVDGTGASYSWTLGDGNTASGESVTVYRY